MEKNNVNIFNEGDHLYVFADDDFKTWYDGISVTISKEEYEKLIKATKMYFSHLNNSYITYKWFVRILEKNHIKYDGISYGIEW